MALRPGSGRCYGRRPLWWIKPHMLSKAGAILCRGYSASWWRRLDVSRPIRSGAVPGRHGEIPFCAVAGRGEDAPHRPDWCHCDGADPGPAEQRHHTIAAYLRDNATEHDRGDGAIGRGGEFTPAWGVGFAAHLAGG